MTQIQCSSVCYFTVLFFLNSWYHLVKKEQDKMTSEEAKQKILDLSRQQEYEFNLAKRSNYFEKSKGTARMVEKRVIQLEK